MIDQAALTTETLRIYQRYQRELVEELGLCPWARDARERGRVRMRVVLDETPTPEQILSHLEAVEAIPGVDIGLLIFPRVYASRQAFARLTARVRELDAERKGRDKTLMALADFHPDVEPDLRSPERLVSFIRRSPDPTIQLVRHTALAAVRMTEDSGTRFADASLLGSLDPTDWPREPEPLSRRVARNNHKTITQRGVDVVRRLMDDILRDRDRSYAKLGLPPPPWSPRAEH